MIQTILLRIPKDLSDTLLNCPIELKDFPHRDNGYRIDPLEQKFTYQIEQGTLSRELMQQLAINRVPGKFQ